jgi:hypothetical protein
LPRCPEDSYLMNFWDRPDMALGLHVSLLDRLGEDDFPLMAYFQGPCEFAGGHIYIYIYLTHTHIYMCIYIG